MAGGNDGIFERAFERFIGWMERRSENTRVAVMIASMAATWPAAAIGPLVWRITVIAILSLTIVVVWLSAVIVELRQRWRIKLARYSMDCENIKRIAWDDFETLMLYFFKLEGYEVERRGGDEPDGGIDLIARKDGKKYCVQCKQYRWEWQVGVATVRETIGAMHMEGADGAIVATAGTFTWPAREMIEQKKLSHKVTLMDGDHITRGRCITDIAFN